MVISEFRLRPNSTNKGFKVLHRPYSIFKSFWECEFGTVLAGPEDVIICVVRGGGVRRTKRAAEKEFPSTICIDPLARVMPYRPVAFMKNSFVVPAGPWRETRHVEHFGSKSKGDVLPSRRVESGFPIGVPMGLCGEALMVEYPEFK